MDIIKPAKLEQGDTIGIVSPAGPVAALCPRRFERGVQYLKSMGFNVEVGKHALNRTDYTAGTIEERVEDLHTMFQNQNVKAIITTIGGYSSHQLLEYLDYKMISQHPKILMGYSDISALLAGIHHQTGLVTFMGPAILPQFGEFGGMLPFSRHAIERVLVSADVIGEVPSSTQWTDEMLRWDLEDDRPRHVKENKGIQVLREGYGAGKIVAANMGSLLLLVGTPYFPDLTNAILCLEDDEVETPATIDRYMTQFRQIGAFEQIAGLVIGRFHSKVGFSEQLPLSKIVERTTRGYDFPVVYDADFGHTDPMLVLPNGVSATLRAENGKCTFEMTENAVL